jgi:hypothetical protein
LTLVRADEFVLRSPDGRRNATFDNAAAAEVFATGHADRREMQACPQGSVSEPAIPAGSTEGESDGRSP